MPGPWVERAGGPVAAPADGSAVVLLHSPFVGPGTWGGVAREMGSRGLDTIVPDLRAVAKAPAPYWPAVARAYAEALVRARLAVERVTLVAHSNAGLLVPLLVAAGSVPVRDIVFLDAGLPPADGSEIPLAPPWLMTWLTGLADATGRLPRWSDWWGPEAMTELVPEPAARAAVIAEQARIPLDYLRQRAPNPPEWRAARRAYVQLSDGYDEEAARAEAAGWPVVRIAAELGTGQHLDQVRLPGPVTEAILAALARP